MDQWLVVRGRETVNRMTRVDDFNINEINGWQRVKDLTAIR